MDKSKISRNHQCNIHTNRQVISVCLEKGCFRPLLCFECIQDVDIHPPDHNKLVSIEEFFVKVDKLQNNKSDGPSDKKALNEVKLVADGFQNAVKIFQENIDLEKKVIDETIKELITSFATTMQMLKQELFHHLDQHADTFAKNYTKFCKLVKRLPSEEDNVNLMASSIFDQINKAATYNDLEKLVKKHQKELTNNNKNKEVDQHLAKLHQIAQNLSDNTTYCCSTILSNTKVETLKLNLSENINKFFAKFLKVQKELSPIDIGTLQVDSKIIKDAKGFEILNNLLKDDYRDPILDLIYRGSRDGFKADDFHSKCDNRGPTLVLIRSNLGKTFGGYTSANWTVDEEYKNSLRSFLFSIDHKEKYKLKPGHDQYAIKGSKALGPCFGGGHDLRLSSNFKSEECSAYIGFSYDSKDKFSKDIYGSNSFYVNEIEVYRVLEADVEEDDMLAVLENRMKDAGKDLYSLPQVVDKKEKVEEKKVDKVEKKDEEEDTSSVSKLVSIDDLQIVVDWIDPKRNFTLDLIYRASKDGFSAESFHKNCDNKGPTLTLIKSKKFGQVFGGFTKQSWNNNNQPAQCAETFVFSVTKKMKFPIIDAQNAILRSSNYGPIFGNEDIVICSNCDKKAENYSNLGLAFDIGAMENSAMFLANEQFFTVENIEVFQVQFLE